MKFTFSRSGNPGFALVALPKFILVRFTLRGKSAELTKMARLWVIQDTYNVLGLAKTLEVSI